MSFWVGRSSHDYDLCVEPGFPMGQPLEIRASPFEECPLSVLIQAPSLELWEASLVVVEVWQPVRWRLGVISCLSLGASAQVDLQ
jgi:hypothetical protein